MRRKSILILALILFCAAAPAARADTLNLSGPAELCFTPGGDCTGMLVQAIGQAQKTIYVQAYSFTSAPIAKALADAERRGVHVEAILDKSQQTARYSGATYLAHAGIPVYIDAKHAIAHNKVMILDGSRVVTGSFNFTKAAQEKNAENLIIIDDAGLAAKYMRNWQEHRGHSEPYAGPGF
jgi:phosphatidylserine/phosphatidylglycerophosphate/cardiolipin synthase-like enzyme